MRKPAFVDRLLCAFRKHHRWKHFGILQSAMEAKKFIIRAEEARRGVSLLPILNTTDSIEYARQSLPTRMDAIVVNGMRMSGPCRVQLMSLVGKRKMQDTVTRIVHATSIAKKLACEIFNTG